MALLCEKHLIAVLDCRLSIKFDYNALELSGNVTRVDVGRATAHRQQIGIVRLFAQISTWKIVADTLA